MSCAGFLMWKWHLSKKGTFLSCMCRLVTFVLLDILSSLVGRKGYNNFWDINPSYCTQWDESKPSWKSSSCIPNHWIVFGIRFSPFYETSFFWLSQVLRNSNNYSCFLEGITPGQGFGLPVPWEAGLYLKVILDCVLSQ